MILAARRPHETVASLVHEQTAVGAAVALAPEAPNAVFTPGALGAMVKSFRLKHMTVHVIEFAPSACAASIDAF